MDTFRRKLAIGAAVLAAAAGVTLGGAVPAAADTDTDTDTDTVSVRYGCSGWGVPGHQATMLITLTAPTAATGQTVTVRASLSRSGPNTNSYEPGAIRGDLDIRLGGASSGVVKATGLTNPRIEAGTPWRLEGGQAQVTLGNAGTVTFTLDVLRVISNAMICMVVSGQTAPVAATTRVG